MLEPRWLALLPLDNSPFSPVEQRNPYATFPNNAKIGNLRRAFRPFPVLLLKPDTSDTTREGKGKEPVRGGADRSECTEMLRGDIEHVRELQSRCFKTNSHSTGFYIQLLSSSDSLALVIYAPFTPAYSLSTSVRPLAADGMIEPTTERRLVAQISGKLLESLPHSSTNQRSNIPRVYIISLAVSPEHERKGYGRQIFHDLLRRLVKPSSSAPSSDSHDKDTYATAKRRTKVRVFVSLHCAVDNSKGRAFYAALGLKENGIVRAYYARTRDGAAPGDAVVVQGVVSVQCHSEE